MKCKALYHRQCVNLSSSQSIKNWLCPCCLVNVPRKDNTNTPVKQLGTEDPEFSTQRVDICEDQDLVLQEIRSLRQEMNDFRKEFGSFRTEIQSEIQDLRGMYQACDSKIEHFAERIENHESRLIAIETSCKEIPILKLQIHDLILELQNKEQMSLKNDIEISGLPEHRGENIMQITGLIMKKIGITIDERDIVEAHRVGRVQPEEDTGKRPRPIIVRFTRRAVHEQVLRSARTRRHISASDIGVVGATRPIFINERLTKQNRLLFGLARSLCKQHKWKFAWTREGIIFLRESDGKPAFRIRCEQDFKKLFK